MDAARYFLCLWACFIVGGLDGAQRGSAPVAGSLFMPQPSSYFHFPPAGHAACWPFLFWHFTVIYLCLRRPCVQKHAHQCVAPSPLNFMCQAVSACRFGQIEIKLTPVIWDGALFRRLSYNPLSLKSNRNH